MNDGKKKVQYFSHEFQNLFLLAKEQSEWADHFIWIASPAVALRDRLDDLMGLFHL